MRTIYCSINQARTGRHLEEMLRKKGYSVHEVQEAVGLESVQAVYKWFSGKSLPSTDNLVIISRLLHVGIEEILVIDGDFPISKGTQPAAA